MKKLLLLHLCFLSLQIQSLNGIHCYKIRLNSFFYTVNLNNPEGMLKAAVQHTNYSNRLIKISPGLLEKFALQINSEEKLKALEILNSKTDFYAGILAISIITLPIIGVLVGAYTGESLDTYYNNNETQQKSTLEGTKEEPEKTALKKEESSFFSFCGASIGFIAGCILPIIIINYLNQKAENTFMLNLAK